MSLLILRGVAVVALILLLWNPASSRLLPAGDQPLVLLDASLSMTGAPWRAALDTARGFARRRAVVWRFGTTVTAFDTTPPAAGASHLAPALEAAAGRAGEVVVVTDGEVDDLSGIPADLLRRPRVIVQPRAPFVDAYVASIEGTRLVVAMGDPERARAFAGGSRRAVLLWPTNGQPGDWYVEPPLSSPFTAALAGVLWDSLPPATAVVVQAHDSTASTVALAARLARRGPARPIVTLEERNGQ